MYHFSHRLNILHTCYTSYISYVFSSPDMNPAKKVRTAYRSSFIPFSSRDRTLRQTRGPTRLPSPEESPGRDRAGPPSEIEGEAAAAAAMQIPRRSSTATNGRAGAAALLPAEISPPPTPPRGIGERNWTPEERPGATGGDKARGRAPGGARLTDRKINRTAPDECGGRPIARDRLKSRFFRAAESRSLPRRRTSCRPD